MLYRNKKENDPCEGKWVGIGGKFEPGEDADTCLKREVFEETGLTVTDYKLKGIIHFISDVLEDEDMYLYSVSGWSGNGNFPVIEKIFEFDENLSGKLIVKMIKNLDAKVDKKENTDKRLKKLDEKVDKKGNTGKELKESEDDALNYTKESFCCNEGTLAWVKKEDVLKLNLWEGDKYFLEPLLNDAEDINMTCEYVGDKLLKCY